jgi:hypothetical protein
VNSDADRQGPGLSRLTRHGGRIDEHAAGGVDGTTGVIRPTESGDEKGKHPVTQVFVDDAA